MPTETTKKVIQRNTPKNTTDKSMWKTFTYLSNSQEGRKMTTEKWKTERKKQKHKMADLRSNMSILT